MTTYRGDDITQFERIESDMMIHTMRCFEADKLDKIVTIKADIMDGKIIVWATTIVPTGEYPPCPSLPQKLSRQSTISV